MNELSGRIVSLGPIYFKIGDKGRCLILFVDGVDDLTLLTRSARLL